MNSPFSFSPTPLEGMYLIRPFSSSDHRGTLKKTFEIRHFQEQGITFDTKEEIETTSHFGVLRGLHLQRQNPQAKLIRCVRGRMFDVAVDLRWDSPTFGKSFSTILDSEDGVMVYVPRGFAHGCLILEEGTTFYYICDALYEPQYDSGILWKDQELGVPWPLESVKIPIISERDAALPCFADFKRLYSNMTPGFSD